VPPRSIKRPVSSVGLRLARNKDYISCLEFGA
jgi:hypothetical protein